MNTDDYLYRFVFEEMGIRGEFVRLHAAWQAVREKHNYPESVQIELGKSLAAVTLLSGTIKYKGSLVLQIQGSGGIQAIVAQATEQRMIRGMARYQNQINDSSFAELYGKGRLILTAEAPDGERYQGIVALEGERLGETMEHYFKQSEQLDTRLWLGADDEAAYGLFIQKMPLEHAQDEDWDHVVYLADTIKDDEMKSLAVEEILHRLFHQEDIRLFDPEPVAFRCGCSRERIEQALKGIGQEEVESIMKEKGKVEVDCEFCNAKYNFDAVDIAGIFTIADFVQNPQTQQ